MSSPRRKSKPRVPPLIVFFFLLLSAIVSEGIKYFNKPVPVSVTVTNPGYAQVFVKRVVDGDTLLLENEERVRLIGIDTPESSANQKALRDSKKSGQDVRTIIQMGKEAKEFTKDLLEGQKIRLEFDAQQKDKYGRLLAYAYKQVCPGECKYEIVSGQEYVKLDDGIYVFINATILKSGYGSPMTIPPNVRYVNLFKRLYKEARDETVGLWMPRSSTVARRMP